MINLAGVATCDETIKKELSEAIIAVVSVGDVQSEVPYTVIGELLTPHGKFTFKRTWYYWMVIGNVPLAIANKIYENKVGKKDVRVAGHCGCPPPKDWVDYINEDGKKLANKSELDKFSPDSNILKWCLESKTTKWVADKTVGTPIITHYHIDSQEGLNLFVEHITKT